MSVETFMPKLWAPALEVPFKQSLVYANPNIANTKFQPMLQQGGKSVTFSTIGAANVREHDRTQDLTYDDISTTELELVMDTELYYGFRVNDVDRVQAAGDFQGVATAEHGQKMAADIDAHLSAKLKDGAGTKLGNTPVFDGSDYYIPAAGQVTAWDVLRKMALALDTKGAPTTGRWAVVGAKTASALLADRRMVEAHSAGTDQVARNGLVGSIPVLGMDIYVTSSAPTVASREIAIAGVPNALAFATQLRVLEALRDPDRFGDLVRGLQVFGAAVTRPDGIVSAEVDVLAGQLPSTGAAAAG